MIKRIILHNFMSHQHTELELAEGVNVIVGPNNCGKSALVAALHVLCTNESGDYMVRHGTDSCRVTVVTGEGDEITWQRVKGTASYIVNGQEFHRLGRGEPPDEVGRLLRLRSGNPDLDRFDVHFADQKHPIFLLDQPGSSAASFFASSSDAGLLLEMQRVHRSKVRDLAREKSKLDQEVADIDAQIGVLQETEALEALMAEAEAFQAEMQAEQQDLDRLSELNQRFVGLNHRANATEQAATVLSELQEPPAIADTVGLAETIRRLTNLSLALEKEQRELTVLEEVVPCPNLDETGDLDNLITGLDRALRRHAALLDLAASLDPLALPPELEDTRELEQLLASWIKLQRQQGALTESLQQIDQQIAGCLDRTAKYLADNPTCPTCGSMLSVETITGGECRHAESL